MANDVRTANTAELDGEALARNALQLMDEGRFDEWEQTMDPECEFVASSMRLQGRKAIREFVEDFHRAFPDVRHTVESIHTAGDTIILEGTFAGTHLGPLRTPDGEIPPTGKPITMHEAQLAKVRNGKAISMRSYFDRMDMMAQLGLLPR
jgi:predicted ester cyclase